MELLTKSFLEVVGTAIVACFVLTAITCLGAALAGYRSQLMRYFVLAVIAFAMLGFVSGSIMSDSREPSVAAVLPAVLTLMGGVAAFHIGSKGVENQVAVCALIFVFSLALYVGSFYGGEVRGENEASVTPDLDAEKNRHAVDLQRLFDYDELQQLRASLASQDKVDLSRFNSTAERQK